MLKVPYVPMKKSIFYNFFLFLLELNTTARHTQNPTIPDKTCWGKLNIPHFLRYKSWGDCTLTQWKCTPPSSSPPRKSMLVLLWRWSMFIKETLVETNIAEGRREDRYHGISKSAKWFWVSVIIIGTFRF